MSDAGSVTLRPSVVVSDGRAEIVVEVVIPKNAHIEAHEPAEDFLIPTILEVDGVEDVHIEYPGPVQKDLGYPGAELLVYEGRIEIKARGRTNGIGEFVGGRLSYQPCVGGACLPPRVDEWRAPIASTSATAQVAH
ncbi:MAG: hypothetical protein ACRDJI_02655 [Actinomycetota bacterium]